SIRQGGVQIVTWRLLPTDGRAARPPGTRPVTGQRVVPWPFSHSAAGCSGYTGCMSDVTRLLDAAAAGDRKAAAGLLPLVSDEVRKLAGARMAAEDPGQPLQPTALVHEASLRLIGSADEARWDSRGHFSAAAAEAMRRILVDAARRRRSHKHGGDRR